MSENYWGTSVPIGRSETELRKLIEDFGASKYGMMENWEDGSLVVMFDYQGKAVRFELNVEKIEQVKLEAEPWNSRRRCSEEEYNLRIHDQAKKVGMRVLVHHVKAMLLAIEYGLFTPDEVLLPHYVTARGRTIAQELATPDLGTKLMNPDRLLLGDGRKK